MKERRTIVANAGLLAVAKVASMVLSLVSFGYLTRTLQPETYGVLAWGLALLGYFSAVTELGLGTLYVREVARAPSRIRELAGWLFAMRVVLVTVSFAGYVAVVTWVDRPLTFKLALVVLGMGLVASGGAVDWVYLGTHRIGRLAVRNVFVALLVLVGAVLAVGGPEDVVMAAAVLTASALIGNAALALAFVTEYGWVRPQIDLTAWRPLLRSAVPIGLALFLMQIYGTIDQVMLGMYRPDTELGWYASAFKILTAIFVVDHVLQQVFLPTLAEAPPSTEAGRSRGQEYVGALAALGIPLALGVAAYPGDLLVFFAGEAYRSGAPALLVLSFFAVVVYVSKAWGDSLVAWGHERSFLRAVAAAAFINIVLNVMLIPPYGPMGAASSTLVSGIAAAVGMALPYRRLVGTLHGPLLARVIAASASGVILPVLGVRTLGGTVWVAALVALPTYISAAYFFGIVPASVRNAVAARFYGNSASS